MSFVKNFHSSVLKFCSDFAAANSLTVFDFDNHVTTNELPNAKLIGPAEFELEVDDGMFTITTMIGIATLASDTNMFELKDLIDKLFDKLMPNQVIHLYDADTAAIIGFMKVRNGTSLMPVVRTDNRPIKFIGVTLATDRNALLYGG